MRNGFFGRIAGLGALFGAGQALAQGEPSGLPVIGAPHAGGVGFQPAVTELASDLHWLDHWLHSLMAVIVLFVTVLLAIVVVKYNRKSNPTPATFTHNTKIEIAWTLVPVLILIVIGSFSLPILFKQLEIPKAEVTIKATGNQWYWNYEYPDYEMSFDSLMLQKDELADYGYDDEYWLLATDTAVVVPVDTIVKVQITAADVIHSWTVPAFGVKQDGVPGRLAEVWFNVDREGIYFGQCSELCGKDHSYMPITVKAVSKEAYEEWLDWAIEEHGGTRGGDAEESVVEGEAAPGAASAAEVVDDAAATEAGAAAVEGVTEEEASGEAITEEEAEAVAPAEEAAAEAAEGAEAVADDAAEAAPAENAEEAATDAEAGAEAAAEGAANEAEAAAEEAPADTDTPAETEEPAETAN